MIRLLFLFVLVSVGARADVSPFVSANNTAYADLEKLEALGCAYPTFRVLAPQTFNDLRAAVDWDPQTTSCNAPEWLLDERQLLLRPSQAAEISADGFVAVDDRVTLPQIPASLWPMFPGRENRLSFNGFSLAKEIFLSGRGGNENWGYAMAIRPGFFTGYDANGTFAGRFYFQEGYVKVGYGFSELTFGRYARRFGNTRHGSVLFSAASAPIDVFEFALRPVVMGGIFSHLGPVTFRTWAGNQGTEGVNTGSTLWGVELGLRPFHWWELAITEVHQFGGTVQSPTVGELFQMFFGGGGEGLSGRRGTTLAFHTGFWTPSKGIKLYGQLMLDRVGDTVGGEPSFLGGLWFPKLGRWDVRLEYARTSTTAYQHPLWSQGLTWAGSPLGHPLGPDGEGAYLDVGLPPIYTWWRTELSALYEARDIQPSGGGATEFRYGAGLSLGRRFGLSDVHLKLNYHQVHNAQYVPGQIVDIFGAGVVFRYTFLY